MGEWSCGGLMISWLEKYLLNRIIKKNKNLNNQMNPAKKGVNY